MSDLFEFVDMSKAGDWEVAGSEQGSIYAVVFQTPHVVVATRVLGQAVIVKTVNGLDLQEYVPEQHDPLVAAGTAKRTEALRVRVQTDQAVFGTAAFAGLPIPPAFASKGERHASGVCVTEQRRLLLQMALDLALRIEEGVAAEQEVTGSSLVGKS